jgi:hydrogenase expression/formation protein HypC
VTDITDPVNQLARVDVAGVKRVVNVGLLDNIEPGDWVLIHVGFALSRVDEHEAQATLKLLEQMGVAYETELDELKASAIE